MSYFSRIPSGFLHPSNSTAVRFGSEQEKKAGGKQPKAYDNPDILPPLFKLVSTYESRTKKLSEPATREFANAWSKDPQGSIATLQKVVAKALTDMRALPAGVGNKQGPRRTDVGFLEGRLNRFLSFFRREFWDTKAPSKVIQEFNPTPKRDEDTQNSARHAGVPQQSGAWYSFLTFVREEMPSEFKKALSAFLPPGTTLEEPPPADTGPKPRKVDDDWID